METLSIRNTLKDAISKIGNIKIAEKQIIFIVGDDGRLRGSITNGDLRRAILKSSKLDIDLAQIMNPKPYFIRDHELNQFVDLSSYRANGIFQIPVVDENDILLKSIDSREKISLVPFDAVIMAGGRGKRLSPLTDTIPKPMLDLAGRPVLEWIIDDLIKYDVKHIYLSVNYLKDKIKNYFGEGYRGVPITYLEEDYPLGTAGALGFISGNNRPVLVTNGDVLNNTKIDEMFRLHIEKLALITIASIRHEYKLPFAVMENIDGRLANIVEKPTMTYDCNAGIYMLSEKVLKEVATNEYLDMPDFVDRISKSNNGLTYVFKHFGYWMDIGTPDDYKKARSFMQYAVK